jgi:hypothetical protein
MRISAIGIELANVVTIDGLERGDAGEFDRAAVLGRQASSSAAVRTDGISWSALGMALPRCAMASRKVVSLPPSGRMIGSGKRRDQDITQLRYRTGIQAGVRRFVPPQKRVLSDTGKNRNWTVLWSCAGPLPALFNSGLGASPKR